MVWPWSKPAAPEPPALPFGVPPTPDEVRERLVAWVMRQMAPDLAAAARRCAPEAIPATLPPMILGAAVGAAEHGAAMLVSAHLVGQIRTGEKPDREALKAYGRYLRRHEGMIEALRQQAPGMDDPEAREAFVLLLASLLVADLAMLFWQLTGLLVDPEAGKAAVLLFAFGCGFARLALLLLYLDVSR